MQGEVTQIGAKIILETDKSSAPFGYNTDWTTVELYSVHDDSETNTTKYYVEGKEVTKEEWDSYAAKVDGQQVAWLPLDWTKLN